MFPEALAGDHFKFLHQDASTFYMQGNADYMVVTHVVFSVTQQTEVVRFEKITESRRSREARLMQSHQSAQSVLSVQSQRSGPSYDYDPSEKEEIVVGTGRWGLEVG